MINIKVLDLSFLLHVFKNEVYHHLFNVSTKEDYLIGALWNKTKIKLWSNTSSVLSNVIHCSLSLDGELGGRG